MKTQWKVLLGLLGIAALVTVITVPAVLLSQGSAVHFLNSSTFLQCIRNLTARSSVSNRRKPKCEGDRNNQRKKDNIYEVCLRKFRIHSRLTSTEIRLNESFVHFRDNF